MPLATTTSSYLSIIFIVRIGSYDGSEAIGLFDSLFVYASYEGARPRALKMPAAWHSSIVSSKRGPDTPAPGVLTRLLVRVPGE